jgi:hypothetical protein
MEKQMNETKNMFLIKIAYWLGIVADALWAVGLLFPKIFGILTGQLDFNPDLQVRLIMGIGGALMTGWTFLLLWAVKQPIERRAVILLTAFPVVFGLSVVALIGFLGGNTSNIWILIKNSILIISMITSYMLASKAAKEKI